MNLLFSKLTTNNQTLKLKKEIQVKSNYDRQKNMFSLSYDPLKIQIESSNGSKSINKFSKKFISIWKNKELPENNQFKNHLNEVVHVSN
jgi:hypothetical protein